MSNREEVIKLLNISGAIPIFPDAVTSFGTKASLDFICACGEQGHTNRLGSIKKVGAKCAECMKKQKYGNGAEKKRKDRGEITDPATQRRCTGIKCNYVKHISEFISDRKPGSFSKLCKKCRSSATKSLSVKRLKIGTPDNVVEGSKKCPTCTGSFPKSSFISKNIEREKCETCRAKNATDALNRKRKLEATPAPEEKQKCRKCQNNRPVNMFVDADIPDVCTICIAQNNAANRKRKEKRHKEKRRKTEAITHVRMCDTCSIQKPLDQYNGEALRCRDCSTTHPCLECGQRQPIELFIRDTETDELRDICKTCRETLPVVLQGIYKNCPICDQLVPEWRFSVPDSCDMCNKIKKERKETLNNIMSCCNSQLVTKETDKIGKETKITYICKCGTERTKTFDSVMSDGSYCKIHQNELQYAKRQYSIATTYGTKTIPGVMKKTKETLIAKYGADVYFKTDAYKKLRTIYTPEYLEKFLTDNGAKLVRIIDVPLTQNSNICYVCSCGKETTGNFMTFTKQSRVMCNECILPITQKRKKATMLLRYGVEHASHSPELFAKRQASSCELKQFQLPSGQILTYQGYENFAFDELLYSYEIDESNIITGSKVPTFVYEFEGSKHVYHPDIFVPCHKWIIEVKSLFTYKKDEAKNKAKEKACLEQGYEFVFWVYDKKGEHVEFE